MHLKLKTIRVSSLVYLIPIFAFSSSVSAATLVTTGSFSSIYLDNYYSYEDGVDTSDPYLTAFDEQITGLAKFDPTLGTLVSATITASFNYNVESTIQVFTGLDEEFDQYHSASFTVDSGTGGPSSAQGFVGIDYVSGISSIPMANDGFATGTSCSGDFYIEGACVNTTSDDHSGLLSSADLLTSPIPQSEFVGSGNIDSLFMSVFVPDGSLWTTENVFDAQAELFVVVDPGSVTLTYEYTPTPVPLPGAAWLFGSALIGAGFIRRKKST